MFGSVLMAEKIHFVTRTEGYGGGIYGAYISRVEGVRTVPLLEGARGGRLRRFASYYDTLYRHVRRLPEGTMTVRNVENAFFLSPRHRNVAVFHHYHPIARSVVLRAYQKATFTGFMRHAEKLDKIVCVSRYWYDFLKEKGIDEAKLALIYNPFEIERYAPKSEAEIAAFKRRYDLEGKPLVYIGNLQPEKGAAEVYEALRGEAVTLVASGVAQMRLPGVRHMQLGFDEYITLLQAADVSVLMSRLHEGWNRVAHESLLCGTPVIGTGYGGMGELLRHAKQTICRDTTQLPRLVQERLRSPGVSDATLAYVRGFDVSRFYAAWQKLFDELEAM